MDCVHSNRQDDIEKMLAGLEKVRVMIGCNHFNIIGQTYYSSEQRFIDMLNKDSVIEKQCITKSLIVTQALLTTSGGEKEQIPGPCFVSKDSIIFIGTFDETRATTSEEINSVKAYPWTGKYIIPTKILCAGKYRLIGQIHSDPCVLPILPIESRDKFLPMTNVSVISLPELREISFDFVAINKNHISLFQTP
ncbi:hypothetical protein ACFLYE_02425 [Chloroflexota bacterium]